MPRRTIINNLKIEDNEKSSKQPENIISRRVMIRMAGGLLSGTAETRRRGHTVLIAGKKKAARMPRAEEKSFRKGEVKIFLDEGNLQELAASTLTLRGLSKEVPQTQEKAWGAGNTGGEQKKIFLRCCKQKTSDKKLYQ